MNWFFYLGKHWSDCRDSSRVTVHVYDSYPGVSNSPGADPGRRATSSISSGALIREITSSTCPSFSVIVTADCHLCPTDKVSSNGQIDCLMLTPPLIIPHQEIYVPINNHWYNPIKAPMGRLLLRNNGHSKWYSSLCNTGTDASRMGGWRWCEWEWWAPMLFSKVLISALGAHQCNVILSIDRTSQHFILCRCVCFHWQSVQFSDLNAIRPTIMGSADVWIEMLRIWDFALALLHYHSNKAVVFRF